MIQEFISALETAAALGEQVAALEESVTGQETEVLGKITERVFSTHPLQHTLYDPSTGG